MKDLFQLVIEKASYFADLEDEISQAMLETAINNSSIDLETLLNLNDDDFKADITGLFENFDFESNQLLNGFMPLSCV